MKSENSFRLAIKSNIRYPYAWIHLGLILYKQSRIKDAQDAYRLAMKIDQEIYVTLFIIRSFVSLY